MRNLDIKNAGNYWSMLFDEIIWYQVMLNYAILNSEIFRFLFELWNQQEENLFVSFYQAH